MESPGERLLYIMKSLKLNQVQLAESLNVTHSTVARWLNLKKLSVTVRKNLSGLEKVHGVNLIWLEAGTGKPFLDDPKNETLFNEGETGYVSKYANLQKIIADQANEIQLLKTKIKLLEDILKLKNLYDEEAKK